MPIKSGSDYIDSLRGRNLKVYLFGELVKEPVDHPMIRPSINAVAETYELAIQEPELGSTLSPMTGKNINRFLHIVENADDLVNQNRMQRKLRSAYWNMFSAMCRNGRLEFHLFNYIRDRS